MKILQVGYTDQAGRRFNGADLHRQLLKHGFKSEHAVWEKRLDDKYTWLLSESKYRHFVQSIFNHIEERLSVESLLSPFSWKLLFDKHLRSVDLVHYHLIYPRFFSLATLPFLSHKKPSIWTLHDPWPLTGHCVHPLDCQRWKTGCGSCPHLSDLFAMRKDRTALMWKLKKILYRFSDLDIVVASKWMYRRVKQSPLFSKFRLHLIPFGLDLHLFQPANSQKAKKQLGILPNSLVLAVRADPIKFKGFKFIKKCLHQIQAKKPICLLTLGKRGLLNEFRDKYQIIDLGWVDTTELLIKTYNASDIFLTPSTAESFGMMAIEAMACGKPVVAFDRTALSEVMFAPKGGIVVPQGNVKAFTRAVKELLNNSRQRRSIGESARKLARKHYNLSSYVNNHINLYKEVIDQKKRK